jgi:hypothetical protein
MITLRIFILFAILPLTFIHISSLHAQEADKTDAAVEDTVAEPPNTDTKAGKKVAPAKEENAENSNTAKSVPATDTKNNTTKSIATNNSGAAKNDGAVTWYKPTIGLSNTPKRSKVILMGKTNPGTKIRIATDEVPVITKKGDVKNLPKTEIMSQPFSTADERGIFELELLLPTANVQLPIEVKDNAGKVQQFQISMAVDANNVALTSQKNAIKSPYARRNWEIWGGIGFNYLKYEQETSDIPSSLQFESFEAPSYSGKLVYSFTEEWAFQFTANHSPGQTSSSNAVQVSQDTYSWDYYTFDSTFFHPDWKFLYKDLYTEVGAQVGIQYHKVPFVARSSTTDPAVANVETNDLVMIAFGGAWNIHYGRYLILETFLRYQLPFYYGDLFDMQVDFAIDGSAGLVYKWRPDWRVGLYWYGQWHKYKFSNHRDVFFEANGGGGPDIDGKQELFYSNIEARIGWVFD